MQVKFHYKRLSDLGVSIFDEDLIAETDERLTTYAVVPVEYREELWGKFWRGGLVPEGVRVTALRKHYFFKEWFDILAWFDEAGAFVGYYTDIATPTRRLGLGEYTTTDLFLDFWQRPNEPAKELDLDEFDEALRAGLMTPELAEGARASFERVRREIAAGIFPYRYIRG